MTQTGIQLEFGIIIITVSLNLMTDIFFLLSCAVDAMPEPIFHFTNFNNVQVALTLHEVYIFAKSIPITRVPQFTFIS